MGSPEKPVQKFRRDIQTLPFNQAVSFLESTLADVRLLSSRQIDDEGNLAITISHASHGKGKRVDNPFTITFDLSVDASETVIHLPETVVMSLKRPQLINVIAYIRVWANIAHEVGNRGKELSKLNLKKMYKTELDATIELIQARDRQLHKPSLN